MKYSYYSYFLEKEDTKTIKDKNILVLTSAYLQLCDAIDYLNQLLGMTNAVRYKICLPSNYLLSKCFIYFMVDGSECD